MVVRIINDRYVLLPNPHSGGMADVYKATDCNRQGCQVAVKVFKQGRIEGDILAESFRRETQALQELKHPHIVELHDSGQDRETGESFLVLEWMEKDVATLLKESPLEGWDSYWERVAFPVLKALAFSHERQCVHRDLKPSNILIDRDGKCKLADFGISKLRRYFRPTVTLREFVSRPFTPPETDEGSYPYTRDVFSFGVVTLKCLTDVHLSDENSISTALDELDAPPEILDIIHRAVSLEPDKRQQNAEVLLDELERVQKTRSHRQLPRAKICYLKLTEKCERTLKDKFETYSSKKIEEKILSDINGEITTGIRTYQDNDRHDDGTHYNLYGYNYRYHVKVDEKRKDCLVILNALGTPHSQLEERREMAWKIPYGFKFGQPTLAYEAKEVIQELQDAVIEHEATLKERSREREKARIFRVWGNILKAKTDWEQNREKSLPYLSYTPNQNRVIFQLSELPEEDITGQARYVKNAKGQGILGGEVEEVIGKELHLYIQYGQADRLPQSGELHFDTRLAEIALNRQKKALDAIRYDRAVRSDLRELLVNPDAIEKPNLDTEIKWIQNLNESQQEAVKAALSTPDFLVVEGPPGTGKTTFITEVILQTLQQNSETRILLSSQTHVAIDNVLERIQAQNPKLKLIRIGDRNRVAEGVHSLLLEEQMERWRENAIATGQSFIQDWSARRNISLPDLELATQFKDLKSIVIQLEEFNKFLDIGEQSLSEISGRFESLETANRKKSRREEVDKIQLEIDRLRQHSKEAKKKQKEVVKKLHQLSGIAKDELLNLSSKEIDEYLSCLVDLDNPEVEKLKRLLKIQSEWFEQFGRNDRFNAPLIHRSRVVAGTCIGIAKEMQDLEFDLCIIDEASKATATEVLVPMARAKKWILVGDPKQLPPFLDEASRNTQLLEKYDLTREEIQETLFDRLLRILPEECHKLMAIQHRMVEPIGQLISTCFYEEKLASQGPELDKILAHIIPHPVTWLTTSKLKNSREQPVGSSFNNSCEVATIVQWLKELDRVAKEHDKHYQVAVLSGYSAQLILLNRRLSSEQNSWSSLTIECNTVDAFQGREADIAIYSVTRSNKKGIVGFLKDEARLNVALSRGRLGLVIVGDSQFCSSLEYTPLSGVLKYIEQHPTHCKLEEVNP